MGLLERFRCHKIRSVMKRSKKLVSCSDYSSKLPKSFQLENVKKPGFAGLFLLCGIAS
jgi:hypothetical protein